MRTRQVRLLQYALRLPASMSFSNKGDVMGIANRRDHSGQARGVGGKVALAIFTGLFFTGVLSACSANLGNSNAPQANIAPSNGTPQQAAKIASGETKIALILPTAGFGASAAVAKSLKQAGEMALFERDDPNIRLLVKDSGGTAEGARVAAGEAVRDGADIILGPLFASSVAAASPITRQANIPVLAFSNDTRVAGNGVYLMSFLAAPEVDRIVSFAASRGKQRFAALIPADAYGNSVEPAFRSAVQRNGGTLVHIERYSPRANAMLDPVKRTAEAINNARAAGAPVDALFLPGGQDTLPQLAPLMAYNGIDPKSLQLLGTGSWDYPNVGREQTLAGGWYPSPDPRSWQDFSGRFARTFGSAPPRLASLAYDAVNIAVSLASGDAQSRYSAMALTNSRGFNGVDGNIMFTPSGLSQRQLAVIEIQQYGNNVIDAAPQFAAQRTAAPMNNRQFAYGSAATRPPVTRSVYVPAPIPSGY
ncbi:MAG: penicillin-binding protein activator [Hyphomicrobiaceae bacterium]